MERVKLSLFCICLAVVTGFVVGVQGSGHHHHHHHHRRRLNLQKLFVFGDSYVDTGNLRKADVSSWKEPYGITFPGKPTGRFSDGRVLTDYLASFVGIRSPIPYKWRKLGPKPLRHGMNFAYGGTGVFDTLVAFPNMTTQIDFFQQLIKECVYTEQDLQQSMALVSVAGNDYTTYLARNGSLEGVQDFVTSLINQLALDLKRINDIGVRRIAVSNIEPLGCLPFSTVSNSYQKCNDTGNQISMLHNVLLEKAIAELNKINKNSTVVVLDLYTAFSAILQNSTSQGRWKFENPLEPCCIPISGEYDCGSVDDKGNKLYTVCEKPETAFFWDQVHPAQMGWAAISSSLRTTLNNLSS